MDLHGAVCMTQTYVKLERKKIHKKLTITN